MKNVDALETPNLDGEKNDSEVNLSPLEKSLKSLEKKTGTLNYLSTAILIGTFLNLFLSIIIFFQVGDTSKSYNSGDRFGVFFTMFFCGVSFLLVLGFLYLYESERKRGEVLFEEISDELEWHVDNSNDKTASNRPKINARISLRSFTKTTDLPFVSGKSGPAFYLILNIVLIIISTIYTARLF